MSLPGKMGDGGLVAEPVTTRWGNLSASFPEDFDTVLGWLKPVRACFQS
jgi:hypothetical protein